MRALLLVVQVLFWLLLIRLVVRAVVRLLAPPSRAGSAPPPRPMRPAEDLVLDRVCRTHVPRSQAVVAVVDGREEHFCSTACRDRALAAIARAS